MTETDENESAEKNLLIAQELLKVILILSRSSFNCFCLSLALIFFIINREISPDEGFWLPLFGAIVGTYIIGYFVAWTPFKVKFIAPLKEKVTKHFETQSKA
ncbi:MAG: hypothetical protein ACYS30_24975 [Planctomycetota bacterium]|jgi:hypothetical protein